MFRKKDKAKQFEDAIFVDDLNTIRRLLKKGFPINGVLYDDKSPLMVAAGGQRPHVVRFLLEHGADVDQLSEAGRTALHFACSSEINHGDNTRFKEVLQLLLDYDAKINATDDYGNTPLHLVCRVADGLSYVVDELIANGSDVDAQNDDGNTPLYYAVDNQNLPLVKQLMSKGADANLTNFEKTSLMDIALDCKAFEIALYLLEHGMRPNDLRKLKIYDDICRENQPKPFTVELSCLFVGMQILEREKQNDFRDEMFPNHFASRLNAIGVKKIPSKLCSPCTNTIMQDPITLSNGLTYDRMSLIRYFAERNFPKSIAVPLVSTPIRRYELFKKTNGYIRDQIKDFVDEQEKLYRDKRAWKKQMKERYSLFSGQNAVGNVGKVVLVKKDSSKRPPLPKRP